MRKSGDGIGRSRISMGVDSARRRVVQSCVMSTEKVEMRLREMAAWLAMSARNQDLLCDRIIRSYTHGQLGTKYRLSRSRTNQIETQFWDRIAMRLFSFDEHYGKHEEKLIGELLKIRLHNPDKVVEILKDSKRPVTMYGFPEIVNRCLETAGIHTVDQLTDRTEKDLRRIRNLGRKRIREIGEILSRHGYSLKQE